MALEPTAILGVCASKLAPPPASLAAQPPGPLGKKMIWKFDNSETYIFGTIHAFKSGDDPYSKKINEIYVRSSTILFEANLDNINHALFTFNDGTKLSDVVSAHTFNFTKQLWIELNLDLDQLEKLKPWVVAVTISAKLYESLGFSFTHGVDKKLLARAKSDNKNIVHLEPQNTAIFCFDAVPAAEQDGYLLSFVEDTNSAITLFNKIMIAWVGNDIQALASVLQIQFEKFPALSRCLFSARNEAWLGTINTCIESGTPSLIAVGALHCVGVGSIQERCRKKYGHKFKNLTSH